MHTQLASPIFLILNPTSLSSKQVPVDKIPCAQWPCSEAGVFVGQGGGITTHSPTWFEVCPEALSVAMRRAVAMESKEREQLVRRAQRRVRQKLSYEVSE